MNKNHDSIAAQKAFVNEFKQRLCDEFIKPKSDIVAITKKLVQCIDEQLIKLFIKNKLDSANDICLLALGSYGRQELQLYSDVDILLLHNENVNPQTIVKAQNFVQDCWDIGLEISQQITSIKEISTLAAEDLSVISSLMDMRLVTGRGTFMEDLLYEITPHQMWSSDQFYYAKIAEQNKRYNKYGETAYNLEPNIKHGPGGLRDLQILLSIGKRHFNIKKLADSILFGFINEHEYVELIHCQHFLWRVRFALHMVAGKSEERLLFDWQIKCAEIFGYEDLPHSLAIEQFMKAYFKNIKHIRELTDMLLQWFREAIIPPPHQSYEILDHEFQLSGGYIEVRSAELFNHRPEALLKLFLWLVERPDILGVKASSIRLIRNALPLIGKHFKQSKLATKKFMAILNTSHSPYEALQRMNRYGVLAHYLEAFDAVTGQMQYDLFHVYTVDQHTLFVIRNIGRFFDDAYKQQFPLATQLIKKIQKADVLYLSALFHDIAKGQGGDHSELGAVEAKAFAKRHDLCHDDTSLLVWLVENHLLMSQTAQRKDIYDLQTIHDFCQKFPKSSYLEYLYLLTVADICATNPTLWTSWKDSLLKELYHATRQAMDKEQALLDEKSLIIARQQLAISSLYQHGFHSEDIKKLWAHFKNKYFLHESPSVIARHTKAILQCTEFPLVLIHPHHSQGGTEVFIYMPHHDEHFHIATTILSNHHVTIQEALVTTCDNEFDLDTYVILDKRNEAFLHKDKASQIKNALVSALKNTKTRPVLSKRRLTRIQAHFKRKPQITWQETNNQYNELFLIANDRPGLLAAVSKIFYQHDIHLHNAKIATAGERVEDMFHITKANGDLLTEKEMKNLELSLLKELGLHDK